MIEVNRQESASVQKQLVEQLRYLVASGHYHLGETLPSTRGLAEQIEVSFHTVRKAYQQLQQEGLLESQPGKGYVVQQRSVLSKEDRMERGADVTRGALQNLIGLGLHPDEIDYLVKEQLDLLETTPHGLKLLFACPYQEQARDCARQVAADLQRPVDAVLFDDLDQHQDADYVFTRHADLQQAARLLPRSEVLGAVVYPDPDVLEHVARLLSSETLGLVTRYTDAIQPLMDEIRTHTGFGGQVVAASITDEARHLRSFIGEIDYLISTPLCERHLKPIVDDDLSHAKLRNVVSADSLTSIRNAVPA